MNVLTYFGVIYFLLLNILGLISMGIDKRKARKHLWRIPEKSLFFIAILGGSIGSLSGMYLFHHKTKHKTFVIGIPVILVLQVILILTIIYKIYA